MIDNLVLGDSGCGLAVLFLVCLMEARIAFPSHLYAKLYANLQNITSFLLPTVVVGALC
jgi:hypothetical protein